MNFKQAAYHVLKDEKRPIPAKEITQIALRDGLIKTDGKTPDATMGAVIYADIKQKGEKQKCLRLFNKNSILIKPNIVHEHFELKKGESCGLLNYPIYHFSYRSIFQVIKKFTNYAKREAKRKIIKNEQITLKKLVLYPPHMFFARCIKDKGYKDGIYRIFLDSFVILRIT